MKRLLLLSLVSFAFFFADGQALQLQHPTGGEVWPAFSIQRIQWQLANVDNIKIEVSTDNARTWSVLQSSYPASATYYDWTVVNKPSDSCFVRITDVANANVQSTNYPGNPFKIPRPTLKIDNVDAAVFCKSALPVTWSSTGTQTIKLFVSYNNLLSYQLIADNVSATKGVYNWAVKDTVASNCYILIQSADDNSLVDTIGQPFAIKALPVVNVAKYRGGSYDGHSSATNLVKAIKLLSPNKKEELQGNTIYPVKWNATSINQIDIKYSIDGGSSWINIVKDISASVSNYNWTVPSTPSNNCLVKIADASDTALYDISDTAFIIKTNSLEFITPDEDEIVYKGQAVPVSWKSAGVSKINISYFDGSVWMTINDAVSANNETFNWVIPSVIQDSIKLKISDVDNPSNVDTISKVIIKASPSITGMKYRGGSYDGHSSATNIGPSLRLVTPNGNNQLASAIQYNITWIDKAVDNVDLAFSGDGGMTWQNIVSSYTNIQSFLWTVPAIASAKCLIRIQSSADSTVSDVSDSMFTILSKQIDLVIDTAITRYPGSALPLEWTQLGIEKIALFYKIAIDGNWQKIKDSISSTQEIYNWILPSLPKDSLWVRICDYKDSSVKDEQIITRFKTLPAFSVTKYRGGSFDGHSFRSTNNKIVIYKPAASDTLASGNRYAISWQSGNVTDSIQLQFSTDSGSTWTNIASTAATNNQYNWTVPTNLHRNSDTGFNRTSSTIVSTNCIVRALAKNAGNEIVGTSNKTFTIVQSSEALPVSIISFTGKMVNNKASLAWVAENEINLNRYEVERSFNGVSYQKVGEVKATIAHNYSFADTTDLAGKRVYYRLKLVDNDGQFKFSAVVTMRSQSNTLFSIYPNPAKTFIEIKLKRNVSGSMNVQVTDVSGKIVQQKTSEANNAILTIYTGNISPGTYVVKIKYKEEEFLEKVIIIK